MTDRIHAGWQPKGLAGSSKRMTDIWMKRTDAMPSPHMDKAQIAHEAALRRDYRALGIPIPAGRLLDEVPR